MKNSLFIFILSCALICTSCGNDDDGQDCTEIFVFGLHVSITDAISGAALIKDIVLTAQDGNYSETLTQVSNSFVGAGERSGTYIITVVAAGYETEITEPIEVSLTDDLCHVHPEVIDIALQPN